MKTSAALFLTAILICSLSTVAFAEDPAFAASIVLSSVPAGFQVGEGETLALTADFTANLDVNRTSWSLDGVVQQSQTDPVLTYDEASGLYSGQSAFTFDAALLKAGAYEVIFKIWRETVDETGATVIDREASASQVVTVYVMPMAAPNVAEVILAFNGVEARYGKGKAGGNYVSDVAHIMGTTPGDVKNTDFNNQAKEEWSETEGRFVPRAEYRQAVFDYLNGITGPLTMPTDDYFDNTVPAI